MLCSKETINWDYVVMFYKNHQITEIRLEYLLLCDFSAVVQ